MDYCDDDNNNDSSSSPSSQSPSSPPFVHTLLLCRHGDSIFNGGEPGRLETFTGWMDVPLSNKGVTEAKASAEQVSAYNLGIDACFTSVLQRAQMTAHYCLWAFYADKPHVLGPSQFIMDWRLTERHYGALQGIVKAEAEAGLHGHDPDLVRQWRRSWYAIPPLLDENDPRRIDEIRKFSSLCGSSNNVPRGESLQQVAENRIRPFLTERLVPILDQAASVAATADASTQTMRNATGLVVAHANSLRALIGVICEVEKQQDNNSAILSCIERLRLPTGQPLVLKFMQRSDGSFQVCDLDGIPYDKSLIGSSSKPSSSDDAQQVDNTNRSILHGQQVAPYLPVWPLAALPLPTLSTATEYVTGIDPMQVSDKRETNGGGCSSSKSRPQHPQDQKARESIVEPISR